MLADLRFAFRQLAKTPGFTCVALITLALGIGANAAIFSVVQSVLLKPLPYPAPGQLVVLWQDLTNFEQASIAWPDLQDWKRDNHSFTAIGGFRRGQYALTGIAEPRMLTGAEVEASFFSAIGLSPALGRVFSEEEDKVGAAPLAVLSHALWQGQFGGDRDILGRSVTLNGIPYTVIGVMPPELMTPSRSEFYTQMARLSDSPSWQTRGNHPGIYAVGRLKPGVSAEAGLGDLRAVSQRISRDHPDTSTGVVADGVPMLENLVGDYRRGLWMLLGAVGLVLLIACANLAGLLIARSAARETEFAVRAALGASRARLIRQLFIESLLLACFGTMLGLLLAQWGRAGIIALSPTGVPRLHEAALNGPVLLATCAIAVVATLLFGLWPAWRCSNPDLRSAMASGGRTGSTPGSRARSALIVAEVALTLTLLVGAGLLLRSFARMQASDLGFRSDHVLTARISLPEKKYPTPEARQAFIDRMIERTSALPGVTGVDFATNSPLNTGWQTSYRITGRPEPLPGQAPMAEMNCITDTYFRTLGIPLLRGRSFDLHDGGENSRAVIVDEAFARREWPNEDPVGKQLRLGRREETPATVVGVVPTLQVYGYGSEPKLPQAYVSARVRTPSDFVLLVKTERESPGLMASLRRVVASIDPDQPLWDVRSMEDRVGTTLAIPRLYTFLLGVFAGIALVLAGVGLYGVLAYNVSLRTREFGIRLAIGAVGSQLVAMVLGRGLQLLGIGVVLGLVGAVGVGAVLESLLYQTAPIDTFVLVSVLGVLVVVALFASIVPALRASRVNPVEALRAE